MNDSVSNYFEDIELNKVMHSQAQFEVTPENIKAFAAEWDPAPFHIDEDAAKASPMGKLFASSIHTVAIGVKLSYSYENMSLESTVAGLGWDKVRFMQPVCPGDVLRSETEVISKRESNSQPGRGVVVCEIRIFNQDDLKVASYEIASLILKRGGT